MCSLKHTHTHTCTHSEPWCVCRCISPPPSTSLSPFLSPCSLLFPPASCLSCLLALFQAPTLERQEERGRERGRAGRGKQTGFRVQVHVQKGGWIESQSRKETRKRNGRARRQSTLSVFLLIFIPPSFSMLRKRYKPWTPELKKNNVKWPWKEKELNECSCLLICPLPTDTLLLHPSLSDISPWTPVFLIVPHSLPLSLSLSSRIFSPPTTSHTPRSPSHSFPSLTVYSHWRSTAPYSFFLFLFSSFFGFWLCSRIQQHRADVLALLYVAPVKKAGRGLSLQWAEYSNSLVFSWAAFF